MAFFLVLSVVVFWLGFGLNPPQWAYGKDKDQAASETKGN